MPGKKYKTERNRVAQNEFYLRYYSVANKIDGGKIVGDKGGTMSMAMRSVCVNVHMSIRRDAVHMAVIRHRQRLIEVRSFVIARRKSVDHHCHQGSKHCDEAREREIPPRVLSEAGAGQGLESIRQDVYETSCEYHSRREGFDHEEHVVFGAQSCDFLA